MSHGAGTFPIAAAGYDRVLKEGVAANTSAYLAQLPREQRIYSVLMRHGTAQEREHHPLNRAAIVVRVDQEMRREMAEERGLISTRTRRGSSIPLTPTQKTQVDDILGRLSALETWNALHDIGRPGWSNRSVRDPQPVLDELRAASPEAYAEMIYRRQQHKVGTFEADQRRWVSTQGRVERLIENENLLGFAWDRTFRRRRGPARQLQRPNEPLQAPAAQEYGSALP